MCEVGLIQRLKIGIKRNPIKLVKRIFITYTVIWAILEPLLAFYDGNIKGWLYYTLMLAFSFIIGVYRIIPPSSIEVKIKNSNTVVKILFGDLFELDGHRIIPVNEYFDSEIGSLVSPLSLHGVFISKILGGVSTSFDTMVKEFLQSIVSEIEPQKKVGKKEKYPIVSPPGYN